jgi:hypothetical protein
MYFVGISGDFVWAWIGISCIITNYVVFIVTHGSLKSSVRFQSAIISYQRVTVRSVILCVDHPRASLFSWRTPIDLSPYSGLRHEDLTPSRSAVPAVIKAFCADGAYKSGPVNTFYLWSFLFQGRFVFSKVLSTVLSGFTTVDRLFFVRRSQRKEIMKLCYCLWNGEAVSVVSIVVKLWMDSGRIVVVFLFMAIFFSSPKRPEQPRGPPSLIFIEHSAGSFSGEGGRSMNLTTYLIWCRGQERVELYVYCLMFFYGVLAVIFILTSKFMVLNSMAQVCMAGHTNRVNYGTSPYGQSHTSCKLYHRSVCTITRIV